MAEERKDLGAKPKGNNGADSNDKSKKAGKKKASPRSRPFTIYAMRKKVRYLKGIIYGEYGVGKTTLAASAVTVPDMKDVLFIDVEAGDLSIDHFEDIDVITPTSFRQFAHVHKFLRNHCKLRDKKDEDSQQRLLELERYLKDDDTIQTPRHYKTVIIDSLSEVQKLGMYSLLGIDLSTYTLDIQPDSPEWGEWGTNTEQIRLLIRLFRNLPMNVIIVCGPRTSEDNKNRTNYVPGLSKALSKEVQGFVDFVGFYVGGVTGDGDFMRRLWLTPGDTFDAKNRFNSFEDRHIDNPTMRDLWELVQVESK